MAVKRAVVAQVAIDPNEAYGISQQIVHTVRISHARLWILRYLASACGYKGNDITIGSFLHYIGIAMPSDELQATLDWLAHYHLVHASSVQDVPGIRSVVALTIRGQEVATGIRSIPGIARPPPTRVE